MGQQAYEAVIDSLSLPDGTLWPVPIVLDVTEKFAEKLNPGDRVALRDGEGFMPAVLTVDDIWRPDRKHEAERFMAPMIRHIRACVTCSVRSIRFTSVDASRVCRHRCTMISRVSGIRQRRCAPSSASSAGDASWHSRPASLCIACSAEITLNLAKELQAHILLHPTVGMTKPGDLQYYARVHCYQAIMRHFPHNLAMLSLLPLAMRMAGPREACGTRSCIRTTAART